MIKNLDNSTPENQDYYADAYATDGGMDEEFGIDEGSEFESEAPTLDADGLTQEIDELKTFAQTQGAGTELLQQLEQKKKLALQTASLSPERRAEVLSEIQAGLETLHEAILAQVEQAPEREALKKEIQDLRGELKAEVLGEDAEKAIADKCEDAEKALKKMDVDSAQGLVEEVKDDLQTAKDDAKTQKQEKDSERKSAIEDMQKRIKKSDLSDEKKDEFTQKIES
ncbi:MAG: hypothetical protein K8R69_07795, partial [Deltaproteobacteria bacterium]|nr:hypothetical protein [Deltaproteobacteria bacterium]